MEKIGFSGWFTMRFYPFLASMLLRLVYATSRVRFINFEGFTGRLTKREQVIYATWHGRFYLSPYIYGNWGRNGITALVSHHRDGEMLTRFLKRFNMSYSRGSTSKGAIGGLKGLLRVAKNGGDIGITPDGPKGPCFKAQMGAIQVAKLTGIPIYPISYSADKKYVFKSWDRFILPKFFSNIVCIAADPIYVSRDATEEAMEQKRLELENSLNEVTERADNFSFARGEEETGQFYEDAI